MRNPHVQEMSIPVSVDETETYYFSAGRQRKNTHDTAQRLAGYDRGGGAFTQAWALDDLGNWTQFDNNGTVQDRTHNSTNQLTAITGGPAFSYDANGNLLADGTRTYTWDALDRLTSVVIPVNGVNTVIANYFYDARNMRVLKEEPTATTSFYYDDMVVAEARNENNSGSLLKSYIHGKQYMHELIMQSTSPTALGQFYLHSHLYNIHALIDQSGNVVERYRYEAYGKRSVFDPAFTPRTASLYAQHFGQTGHYLDSETGSYYYGYRYMAPDLGRWLSRDLLSEVVAPNLYALVVCTPFGAIDLIGLAPIFKGPYAQAAKDAWENICNNATGMLELAVNNINNGPDFEISFVGNGSGVILASAQNKKVNWPAIQKYGNTGVATTDSILMHEMVEQWQYQTNPGWGGNLAWAHEAGAVGEVLLTSATKRLLNFDVNYCYFKDNGAGGDYRNHGYQVYQIDTVLPDGSMLTTYKVVDIQINSMGTGVDTITERTVPYSTLMAGPPYK